MFGTDEHPRPMSVAGDHVIRTIRSEYLSGCGCDRADRLQFDAVCADARVPSSHDVVDSKYYDRHAVHECDDNVDRCEW